MKSIKAATIAVIAGSIIASLALSVAGVVPRSLNPVTTSPMLSALARYLNVSLEQAGARLARQDQVIKADADLRRRLGRAFAGSWLTDGGQTLNVAISDPAQAALVRAAGAHPRTVTRDWATLQHVGAVLTTAKRPAWIVGWHPDPAANTVVVEVKPNTEAVARTWLSAHVDPAAVQVATSTENPIPMDGPYIRGGVRIDKTKTCSVGFAARRGNDHGFVTAGHCGKVGDAAKSETGNLMGTFKQSVYSEAGDMAYVQVAAGWSLMAEVWRHNGTETVDIDGSDEAPIGAAVCRSGQTSGWQCGTILAKNVSIESATTGIVTKGLTRTSACSQPGDSGGPFLAGNQVQGVLSKGRDSDCSQPNTGQFRTHFQPAKTILDTFGLELLTEHREL